VYWNNHKQSGNNMSNSFDEISRSMAQSITRRQAIKKFGVALAGLTLARLGLHQAQAIINGTLDGNAHPNVGVGIFLKTLWPGTTPPVVCASGILIHPRLFLTAGHATVRVEGAIAAGTISLADLLVSFASDANDPKTWRTLSGILTHPGYINEGNDSADVGVLILAKGVTRIAPAALPPLGFLDGLQATGQLTAESRFTVVGYGVDLMENPGHILFPPDGLRRVAYPEFQNLHERWLYSDQNEAHDNGGSCSCDSGGPLFWADPVTGQETLGAIVSRGSLSSAHDYRVDTEEALTFINQVIEMVNAGTL
jgi:hypothetical protein